MTKIKKQSEIEKALELAFENYKSSLQSILGIKELDIEVDVVGVKLSTLAVIVEEGDGLDLCIINNAGAFDNHTRTYIELGNVSYENIK